MPGFATPRYTTGMTDTIDSPVAPLATPLSSVGFAGPTLVAIPASCGCASVTTAQHRSCSARGYSMALPQAAVRAPIPRACGAK